MKTLAAAIFISLLLTGCGPTKDELGASMLRLDPVVDGRIFEKFPIVHKCFGMTKDQYALEFGETWREGVSLAKHKISPYPSRDDARKWGILAGIYVDQKMLKNHSDVFLKGLTGKERAECMSYYNTYFAKR